MTAVTFFRSGDLLAGFRAKGHSGYAEEGSDIVCAAVSALTQTAQIGLVKVAGAKIRANYDEKKALLEVLVLDQDAPSGPAAQVILRTLEEGILDIEQQYPEFVRVTYQERRQTK